MALGALNEGDCLHDFVGPLGKASEFDGLKKVAVVGGGLGCAIAYPQAKKLHEMGVEVDLIAGFRSKDIIILEDEMKNACTNLHIVHRRRLERPQGSGHAGAQGADRRGQSVRCRHRHRPDDHDEVRLRDHQSVRHQDHRFHEHHHGRRHRHVRRLPSDRRRRDQVRVRGRPGFRRPPRRFRRVQCAAAPCTRHRKRLLSRAARSTATCTRWRSSNHAEYESEKVPDARAGAGRPQ